MSEDRAQQRGYYRMARGWMEHDAISGGAFDRRSAWAWLIENAAWTPRRIYVGNKPHMLARGELLHSLRYIARAWRWSVGGVQRFLALLETESMVSTRRDSHRLVITVCNYDKYQLKPDESDSLGDSPDESFAIHSRFTRESSAIQRRKKDNELKEGNEGESVRLALAPLPATASANGAAGKPASPAAPAKARKATRIPDDWQPSTTLLAWAHEREPMVDVQRQVERFVDYFRSASGSKARKLDWDATFRVWIGRAGDDVRAQHRDIDPNSPEAEARFKERIERRIRQGSP